MSKLILPEEIVCDHFDSLTEYGKLPLSPKWILRKYQIELFLEDGGITYRDEFEYKIIKNFVCITPTATISYHSLPIKTIYMLFEPEGEIKALLDSLPRYFYSQHHEQLKKQLDELIVLNNQYSTLLTGSKLLSILDILREDASISENPNDTLNTAMHKAKRFIEANFRYNISTADIAKSVNLSESRLRFLYKKTYGISPHDYLTRFRILSAKRMLSKFNVEMSISEIAELCGFGCQQYFNDVFKRETGITPGKYKNDIICKYSKGE